MLSPARQFRMRALAAAASAAAEPGGSLEHASGYELMMHKLRQDRSRLKRLESQAAKIELKRELLPDYMPYIEGALQGRGAQDEVLMTVMVWRIDAGDWSGALEIAEYALRYKLDLPDQFGRNLPCLIAEEFADQAARGEGVPCNLLIATDRLLADKDMPDQVRAKLAKAIGYAYLAMLEAGIEDEAEQHQLRKLALEQFQRALRLHDKAGVKKDIERLERELKKSQAKPEDNTGTG